MTDPKKYDIIEKYPVPKNADEVRRFVSFCNYYRKFIENFALISRPLNQLLKKNSTFQWKEAEKNAFEQLKHK